MMNWLFIIGMVVGGIVAYEYQVLHVGFELAGDGFHILSKLANSNSIKGLTLLHVDHILLT